MTDIVERGAQALGKCERDNSSWPLSADVPWDKAAHGYKARLRHSARAALLAALDPTDVVLARKIAYVIMGGNPTPLAGVFAEEALDVIDG